MTPRLRMLGVAVGVTLMVFVTIAVVMRLSEDRLTRSSKPWIFSLTGP